jgi:hypothetical protein
MTNMKQLIATAATAAVLATGGVAVAGAADSGDKPAAETGTHRRHPRLHVARFAFRTAAETIGIEPKELRTEVRGGKTIAQVAQEHNVEPQTVIDAITKVIDERVAQRVQHFVEETPHRPAQ